MSNMKRLLEKMSEQGLQSYIVSISSDQGSFHLHFWAENAGEAGYQADSECPYADIDLIETREEFEARTGIVRDYPLPSL